MARYSTLLENPRRRRRSRRRSGAPKRRRSARRRSNPFARRSRRRGGRRRSNPFKMPGMGGVKGTLTNGVQLYLGRLTSKVVIGLANKVEAISNLSPNVKAFGLGLLMPMLPVGGQIGRFLRTAGAITIAGGIALMTKDMEEKLFQSLNVTPGELGLSDYVTDSGMSEYGLLEYGDGADEQYLNDYVTDQG